MMTFSRIQLLGFWLLTFSCGCGATVAPSTVECTEPVQSRMWLLSEVDDSFDTHPNSAFPFPIRNGTDQAVQLRVRAIGCSCYQLRRGATRLKVGDEFLLPAGQSETLTLHAPRPHGDRSSDYTFSLEHETQPGEPLSVISCQGTLVCVSDLRVNPSLVNVEFLKETAERTVRFEVTRTARSREACEKPLVVSGWPETAIAEPPQSVGEVVEVAAGVWKQTWRVVARIPRPTADNKSKEFWPIRVAGPETTDPSNQVQLRVQMHSGLSGPKLVHFGDVKAGQAVTRRIQIIARDGEPFRIIGPSEPAPLVSIQPDSTEAVKTHWGNVTLAAGEAGEFYHLFQVSTDHPEQPTLDIEIRAHVTP